MIKKRILAVMTIFCVTILFGGDAFAQTVTTETVDPFVGGGGGGDCNSATFEECSDHKTLSEAKCGTAGKCKKIDGTDDDGMPTFAWVCEAKDGGDAPKEEEYPENDNVWYAIPTPKGKKGWDDKGEFDRKCIVSFGCKCVKPDNTEEEGENGTQLVLQEEDPDERPDERVCERDSNKKTEGGNVDGEYIRGDDRCDGTADPAGVSPKTAPIDNLGG